MPDQDQNPPQQDISRQPVVKEKKKATFEEFNPFINILEGSDIVLRCKIKEGDLQAFSIRWGKKNSESDPAITIFHTPMIEPDLGSWGRYKFIGDLNCHDYSIEISSARINDSGIYLCTVIVDDDGGKKPSNYTVGEYHDTTTVTVQPRPPIVLSTTDSSAANQLGNSLTAAQETADLISASNNVKGTSQVIARDILSHSKTSQFGSHYSPSSLIPSASTAHNGLSSSSLSSVSHPLMLAWPYVILVLAFVLMFANAYLIYQLVQRHMRKSKSDRLSRKENSLESDSNGGGPSSTTSSGSGGSAATTSSGLDTTANNVPGPCDLGQPTEVPIGGFEGQTMMSVDGVNLGYINGDNIISTVGYHHIHQPSMFAGIGATLAGTLTSGGGGGSVSSTSGISHSYNGTMTNSNANLNSPYAATITPSTTITTTTINSPEGFNPNEAHQLYGGANGHQRQQIWNGHEMVIVDQGPHTWQLDV